MEKNYLRTFSKLLRFLADFGICAFLLLSVLTHQALAQLPENISVTVPSIKLDEQMIKAALGEVVQGIRSGDAYRVSRFIGNRNHTDSKQVGKQLAEVFQNARKISGGESSFFDLDSLQIKIEGDSAEVSCLAGVHAGRWDPVTLKMKKEMGVWHIYKFSEIVAKIEAHVTKFRFNSFDAAQSAKSSLVSKGALKSATVTTGTNIVESHHLFIPKRYYTSPDKWLITKSDAQSYLDGQTLFSSLTDIESVPLTVSGGVITEEVSFVLDQQRQRIVYGEMTSNWIKSYGDRPNDYNFLDSRGMRALKMPDGSVNLFVAEASKGEIVQLVYNHSSGYISYLRSIKGPLQIPVDVDVDVDEISSGDISVWVADKGLRGVVHLDLNGTVISSFSEYWQYTIGNFPLDNVVRIFSDFSNNSIGFIDRNQMAFVVVSRDNFQMYANLTRFDAPSNLTNIGRSYPDDWVVVDEKLNEVHFFNFTGQYLASYKSFNSDVSVTPTVFSPVNGVNLFNFPIASGGGGKWNNRNIPYLDLYSGNNFLLTSGFGRFLPGSDIVNFNPHSISGGFTFDYDVAGFSYFTGKIYDQWNAEVKSFGSNSLIYSGHCGNTAYFSELGGPGLKTFTLRLSVIPANNSVYNDYQQNPVQVNYTFAPPIAGSIEGPSSAPSGNVMLWAATMTSGSNDFSYSWYRQNFGSSSWTLVSTSSSFGQQMGSQSFTLRCDVTDNLNGNTATYTQFVSHVTLSGTLTSNEIWSGGSPIFLTGQVTVPNGLSLTIQPNAFIFFPSGVSLVANGTLTANSATFTSAGPTWGSINFSGSSASGSRLNYCTVLYSYGIQCNNGANVTIDNCTISNSTYGVLCDNSSPVISNNLIHNISTHGVCVAWNSNPRIENNTITNSVISSGFGVYVYSASGYINCNTISGFTVGVYPRTGSTLGAWSGNPANGGYNYTPAQNNIIIGNTYGVDTWDQTSAFLGYYDYNNGTVHGGNNDIEGNIAYDLVTNNYTNMYAKGNWFGDDLTPTHAEGSSNAYFVWSTLSTSPWGGHQLIAQPETGKDLPASLAKRSTVVVPSSTNIQATNSDTDEDKFFQDAVSDQMNKSYVNAQQKYRQLISSKKYSTSALVLLSHLFRESDDGSVLTYFEDLKSNASSHAMDVANLPLATNLLANMHGWRGNYVQALALYDDVIKEYPNSTEERNARVQRIYYTLKGIKDESSAAVQLKDLLSKYDSGDDIEMITNFVNHSVSSPSDGSKSLPKDGKVDETITEYSLFANYPNPFNPLTIIGYQIPKDGMVTLKIYDMLGREVQTLVNEYKTTGRYSVEFDAGNFSSGMYVYRITSGEYTAVKKMLLVK